MFYRLLLHITLVSLLVSCIRETPEQSVPEQGEATADIPEYVGVAVPESSADTLLILTDERSPAPEKVEQSDPVYAIRHENIGTLVPYGAAPLPAYNDTLDGYGIGFISMKFPQPFRSRGNKLIMLHFENDILAERDLYYSNGLGITIVHPFFSQLALNRLLPGLGYFSQNLYGIHLKQEIYTPDIPESPEIDSSDRPFAGILNLGFFRLSYLPEKHLRMRTELQIGVMGKPSLAEALQYWAHRREPNGWVHQMHNDILLNINIELEKSLLNPPNAELGIHGGARAGTLHNRLTGGAFFRFGEIGSILPSPASRIEPMVGAYRTEKWQVWVFGKTEMRLVGYDATLNGGFFNRNSPHTFSFRQMEKFVVQSELGFVAVYKQFGLQFSYTFLSPEFKGGIKHVWGGLHLIYNY